MRVIALLLCIVPTTALADSEYSHLYGNPTAQRKFMEIKIHEYFPGQLGYTMIEIANCESTGLIHWLPNGKLRPHSQGKSSAAGAFQVLLRYRPHRENIKRMKLDMNNVDDYLKFVRYLYKQQGLHPWDASRPCWQRRVAHN
jgi:hypothetical protein